MLPAVLNFNAEACPELYAELAAVYPEPSIPRWVLSIGSSCLSPRAAYRRPLEQANIPESDLPMLASDAMFQQRLLINNPREVMSRQRCNSIEKLGVVGHD